MVPKYQKTQIFWTNLRIEQFLPLSERGCGMMKLKDHQQSTPENICCSFTPNHHPGCPKLLIIQLPAEKNVYHVKSQVRKNQVQHPG